MVLSMHKLENMDRKTMAKYLDKKNAISQIFLFNFLPYSSMIIRTLAKIKSALLKAVLCLMLYTVDPLSNMPVLRVLGSFEP